MTDKREAGTLKEIMLKKSKQLSSAIKQISQERGISQEAILESIESAIAAAYRKDYGKSSQKMEADFDLKTGEIDIYQVKEVVSPDDLKTENGEKRPPNEEREILLKKAKEKNSDVEPGDTVRFKLPDKENFGRIAAQTAKQVIIQKVREAEKNSIYEQFKDREGEIVSGVVQRIEGKNVYVDLDRTTGILLPMEQIPGEKYKTSQRLKVLIVEVKEDFKESGLILSRSRPSILKKMFTLEVPEVGSGAVEIKSVAREAGARSKIAVYSEEEGVDPIGSLVGQKGTRIQTVVNELNGEMIDVVRWKSDPKEYIAQSLSPAKVSYVEIDKDKKEAKAYVPEDQLSLAIGKKGQNVRLAARLTGWKIDVEKEGEEEEK